MAKWSTRDDADLRAPKDVRTDVNPRDGVVFHWAGGGSYKRTDHADCLRIWKTFQDYHMSPANPNNYNDIAYNLGVCHHGYIIEGRSTRNRARVRGGANGTAEANEEAYSVCAIWGRGDGEPTALLLETYIDARDFLRTNGGAGSGIKGHRDHAQTECPGEHIYRWIKAGAPVQTTIDVPIPKPADPWDGKSYPGRHAFRLGQTHPAVTKLGERLIAHGYGRFYRVGPGPTFTTVDLEATKAFQRAQGWRGADADGYPGPVTWERLMARPKRNYTPPPYPKGIGPNRQRPSAVPLQRALKVAGYMSKSVQEHPNYGPKTQAAVAKFHDKNPEFKARGVKRDIEIGPKGWAELHRQAYG